jgi:PAS domain S-box-containing protein
VNKRLRILMVEDDPRDAALIERELRAGGLDFTLQRVDTEADYLRALNNSPDLILSDHDLPAFDGLSALAIAKEKAENVPFVFVTGSAGEEVAIQSLRSGAADYVRKQKLSALLPAVERALQGAEERRRRRAAEEAWHRSEERLRLLVEGVQDYAICLLDADGCITSWNSASERIEGYRPDDLIGRHFSFVFNPEDQKAGRAEESIKIAAAKGRYEGEFWLVRKDASGYWANVVLTSLHGHDGRLIGFTEVIRNITERKRSQEEVQRWSAELEQRVNRRTAQLEAANRELEAFSYSVSHDLRAPLRHIEGFIAMLRESAKDKLDQEQQEMLGIIADSAKKMDRLIDDLLAFSRMARAEMLQRKVNMAAVVEQARHELRPQMERRKIKWTIQPLPEIDGDPALLRQVILNLLANALKFTVNRGEARIEIGSRDMDREHVFFVRDNGVGFDQNYAHKLFGVFQRLHPTNEFPGTGIGLAIVRRIIARHGGRTWAEGEVDRGATFYFSIPKTGKA